MTNYCCGKPVRRAHYLNGILEQCLECGNEIAVDE